MSGNPDGAGKINPDRLTPHKTGDIKALGHAKVINPNALTSKKSGDVKDLAKSPIAPKGQKSRAERRYGGTTK